MKYAHQEIKKKKKRKMEDGKRRKLQYTYHTCACRNAIHENENVTRQCCFKKNPDTAHLQANPKPKFIAINIPT